MKHLRSKLYVALLPLQMLLVGLAVWSYFLVQNLDTLFVEARVQHIENRAQIDAAMQQLNELKLVVSLRDESAVTLLQQAIRDKADAYLSEVGPVLELVASENTDLYLGLTKTDAALNKQINKIQNIAPKDATEQYEKLAMLVENCRTLLKEVEGWSDDYILMLQGQFSQKVSTSIIVVTFGIALCIIGTLIITWQIGRMIVKPVELLHEKIDDVSRGNFDTVVRMRRKDEIGGLSVAFNQMVKRLRTYRQLTDEKLLSTTRTFRTVLERTPLAVIFMDAEGRHFYSNPEAEKLLDALNITQGLPPGMDDQAETVHDQHIIITERDLNKAVRLKVHGEDRYYLTSVFPVDLIDTELAESERTLESGIAVILHDVTRMKLADDLKSNVLATVSHELKTPITSARLALHLLSEGSVGELNEEQNELVSTAREDIERQLATIQNLLDLSKIEKNDTKLEFTQVVGNALAESSIAAHRELARNKQIKLQLTPDETQTVLKLDEKKIGIVLNNLLSNAIRHSPSNSVIEIIVEREAEGVRFSVRDKGPGIDPSLHERIFQRYEQGESETGSSGLGLYIAREIVTLHQGEIRCNSTPGEGSTFTFFIPVRDESTNNPQPKK